MESRAFDPAEASHLEKQAGGMSVGIAAADRKRSLCLLQTCLGIIASGVY